MDWKVGGQVAANFGKLLSEQFQRNWGGRLWQHLMTCAIRQERLAFTVTKRL
jgi:hypothetical protein